VTEITYARSDLDDIVSNFGSESPWVQKQEGKFSLSTTMKMC
jgi:hypothetical protein